MGDGDSLPHVPLNSDAHQRLFWMLEKAGKRNGIRIELFQQIHTATIDVSLSLHVLN
jgi:hypothetical protein